MYLIECPGERDASEETLAMDTHVSASNERNIDSDDNEIEDGVNYDTSVDQDTLPTTRPTQSCNRSLTETATMAQPK